MPRSTRMLAAAAIVMTALWLWAWIGLDWTVPVPAPAQPAEPSLLHRADAELPTSPQGVPIDSTALLERPAFYPDRRTHPFQPGAKEEAVPKATLDFELTTTVVGTRRSFAMLRLKGGGNTVIARTDEPFKADPSWRVVRIDRNSVSFVNAQGTPLTLTIKPPIPAQPGIAQQNAAPRVAAVPAPAAASLNVSAAAPTSAPAAAVLPMQDNAELRARIEARRREVEANAQAARTQ